jgi:hypothetical protein
VTRRLALFTNELGFEGSTSVEVRGQSVVSMAGVGWLIALNSAVSLLNMSDRAVSIAGPAGTHLGLVALAACPSDTEGNAKRLNKGPGRLERENTTASKMINLNPQSSLRFSKRENHRPLHAVSGKSLSYRALTHASERSIG